MIAHSTEDVATATMTVDYKKPLPIPTVILCKAWVDRMEGKKLWARATIESGEGLIYATGEGIFVETKIRAAL